jgi:membrane protease subunit HflK
MYLETMEEILRRNPMVIVDDRLQGIVPFLPLGEGGMPARPPQGNLPATRPAPLPAAPPGPGVVQSRNPGVPR